MAGTLSPYMCHVNIIYVENNIWLIEFMSGSNLFANHLTNINMTYI